MLNNGPVASASDFYNTPPDLVREILERQGLGTLTTAP